MSDHFRKYLASFFKREWTLDDYPLSFRHQENPDGHPNMPSWIAMIWGMQLMGTGPTKEAARLDLQARFDAYKSERPLPRPGTRAPIQFADTKEIDRHGDFAFDFVERVFGISPFFLSDQSSLSDFDGVIPMEEVHAKILAEFGVQDVSKTEPLWKLLDRAVAARDRR
ncbi:MAG: hypothetical protein HYV17_14930 [Xanthomonadales bacterium]|nr:hypothetical protein [Xanthomonadales bacterium]